MVGISVAPFQRGRSAIASLHRLCALVGQAPLPMQWVTPPQPIQPLGQGEETL